jgi:ribosomal protein L1
MNEETFNLGTRKFLKKVGVTSQREIEKAVREAIESGKLKGDETIKAKVTLEVEELDVKIDIDGAIELE